MVTNLAKKVSGLATDPILSLGLPLESCAGSLAVLEEVFSNVGFLPRQKAVRERVRVELVARVAEIKRRNKIPGEIDARLAVEWERATGREWKDSVGSSSQFHKRHAIIKTRRASLRRESTEMALSALKRRIEVLSAEEVEAGRREFRELRDKQLAQQPRAPRRRASHRSG
jgi:hypothetical protein